MLQITSRFFDENRLCYALTYQTTHLPSAEKSFGAVRIDLDDYFGQKLSQTMSGLHINRNCKLVG